MKKLFNISLSNDFMNVSPKAQATKTKQTSEITSNQDPFWKERNDQQSSSNEHNGRKNISKPHNNEEFI